MSSMVKHIRNVFKMKNKKVIVALSVILVLVSSGIGYASIFSNGTKDVEGGQVYEYTFSSYGSTETWTGLWGNSSSSSSLTDSSLVEFASFGDTSTTVVIATLENASFTEEDLYNISLSELNSLDSTLGLSGSESFSAVFSSEGSIQFNSVDEVSLYKEVNSGRRTYLLKIGNEALTLENIVYVTEINPGLAYNGEYSDYDLILYGTGGDPSRTYSFKTA